MPEAAFFVGQFGRYRAAVEVDDAVVRVAVVVLFDRLDQGGCDVGAAALHDERHVLVGGALERDQRIRRLRLVVERHQFELLAERAALALMWSMMYCICFRLASPTCANGPESGSV